MAGRIGATNTRRYRGMQLESLGTDTLSSTPVSNGHRSEVNRCIIDDSLERPYLLPIKDLLLLRLEDDELTMRG